MIIKSIRVQNYRCVSDEVLACDDLVALVGPNGAGKSTFLQALNLFYSTAPRIDEEDFCGHQTANDIAITLTFARLGREAATQFAKYLRGDELSVVRVFHWADGKSSDKYHGSRLQRAEFLPLRALVLADLKNQYATLRGQEPFVDLPKAAAKGEMLAALDAWEEAHPELCTRMADDGQFFGFKSVGAGYLGKFSRFVLVPAVRDASTDGEEGKESLFTQLVNLVVRGDTAGDAEIAALNVEVAERYKAIVADKKDQGLRKLEQELAESLAVYVRDSDIKLSWGGMPDLALPRPVAIAKVGEDGHLSGIEKKGHGLQRAFIMALLQLLEAVRTRGAGQSAEAAAIAQSPDLVIGIEEPELYQHPDRQRHMAAVLARLATIPGDEQQPSSQVFYTTHSPHFVGLDRFDRVRLARKASNGAGGMETRLSRITLAHVAAKLAEVSGGDPARFTAKTLAGRLQTIMTPWMNEGFFTDVVVLVEGEQDRAALMAVALMDGEDLEQSGIAVIPCLGKNNMDRPALIFRGLGISTYVLFDSDDGKAEQSSVDANRRLLRIVSKPEEDYPEFVDDDAACFKDKLETTLTKELGAALLTNLIDELVKEYEVGRTDILKHPTMMAEVLTRASAKGSRSKSLDAIKGKILALRAAVKPAQATAVQ